MQLSAQLEDKQTFWQWFPMFLKHELAPYPGRLSVVTRMIIAATVTMIIVITFKIPYGSIGVNCAFILSRENLRSTAKSGFYFILAFAAWIVLLPVGARMFASVPLTHFLWEAVTVFVCFFLLKTLAYFPLATGVVVVGTATLTIWYLPGPAELNTELTLWQILATTIGAVITLLVEVVFRYFVPGNRLLDGITDRLRSIEGLLTTFGRNSTNGVSAAHLITQYAITGTSMLRQDVARSHLSALERSKISALIGLTGRSIDISAALVADGQQSEPISRKCAEALGVHVSTLRQSIQNRSSVERRQWVPTVGLDSPRFLELEETIRLMESVLETNAFVGSQSAPYQETGPANRLFVSDAFSNPEYLRFALAGTAASMLCYVIYAGLNWPGISTAVTTCALTALSDVGSSRQKQLLRIAGAAIGGFVFGLGSQIFILPYIDSIVGLAILFACVTGIAAYVATSSPRLSYVGLQMAFAFYLINVTSFDISLDLTIGRDRAIGVLLGIASMWFVFERLYPRPAAVQMVRLFARSARLLAAVNSVAPTESGIVRIRTLRDEINNVFASVNAEADAVLFESGEERPAFLAGRDRIRRWLSSLRTLYLLELPLLPFRPSGERKVQSALDRAGDAQLLLYLSGPLTRIAEHLENEIGGDFHGHPGQESVQRECNQIANTETVSWSKEDENFTPSHRLLVKMAFELERDVLTEPVFQPQELQSAAFSGCSVNVQ
jgi:multidrug resistance protein MdtO